MKGSAAKLPAKVATVIKQYIVYKAGFEEINEMVVEEIS